MYALHENENRGVSKRVNASKPSLASKGNQLTTGLIVFLIRIISLLLHNENIIGYSLVATALTAQMQTRPV